MSNRIRNITTIGLLIAMEIVLYFVGSLITVGTAGLNLGLIPITVAAILYGVKGGLLLGFTNSILVLADSKTYAFYSVSVIGTIIVCLFKSIVAGFLSAIVFKQFKKRKMLGCTFASITTALVNTSSFILFSLIFFIPLFEPIATEMGVNAISAVIISAITINFLIEILISTIICPALYRVTSYKKERYDEH